MIERYDLALAASATAVKIHIDGSQPKLIYLFVLMIVALLLPTLRLAVANNFGNVKSNGKGDFVIWDNRILMHKANGDYDMSEDRYLYRIMLRGDRPYL